MKITHLILATLVISSTLFTSCKKEDMNPLSLSGASARKKCKIFFFTGKKIDSTDQYFLYVNEVLIGKFQTEKYDANSGLPNHDPGNMLYVYASESVQKYHIKVTGPQAADATTPRDVYVDTMQGDGGSMGATFGQIDEEHIKGWANAMLSAPHDCNNGEECNYMLVGW